MKHVDVKSNTHIDFNKQINNKDPKVKIGDFVVIWKYQNIFAKGYIPSWFKEVFVIKKVENSVSWTYVISDIKEEEIVEKFYEK